MRGSCLQILQTPEISLNLGQQIEVLITTVISDNFFWGQIVDLVRNFTPATVQYSHSCCGLCCRQEFGWNANQVYARVSSMSGKKACLMMRDETLFSLFPVL